MAIILYKITVDLVSYESDFDIDFTSTTREKYRNPIYSSSLVRASMLRSQYGSEYVSIDQISVKENEWEPVDWEKLNAVS